MSDAQFAELFHSIWSKYQCQRCDGTRVVEEPRYGWFAVEATRPIPCPACTNPTAIVAPRQPADVELNDDDPWKPEGGYGTFDFDDAA